nr:cell death-inducing p53-target protein 1-like isoform X1 [Onthophagus taurus]
MCCFGEKIQYKRYSLWLENSMETHKEMDPPYPSEDNRPYPPPYSEHPKDVNNFPHPLANQQPSTSYPTVAVHPVPHPLANQQPSTSYPIEAVHPVPNSNIPHIYPPYPPPPVTSPPSGVTTIQVIEAQPAFGTDSQYARCTNCGVQGFTIIKSKPTTTTHIIALILCCVILWPLVWIPYVCSSCQKTVHYCPSCNQYLGENTN